MPKRILSGVVISSNSNKTIVVNVQGELNINCIRKLLVDQKSITFMMRPIIIKLVTMCLFRNQNQFQN